MAIFECDIHGIIRIEAKNEKEAMKKSQKILDKNFNFDGWLDVIEATEVNK